MNHDDDDGAIILGATAPDPRTVAGFADTIAAHSGRLNRHADRLAELAREVDTFEHRLAALESRLGRLEGAALEKKLEKAEGQVDALWIALAAALDVSRVGVKRINQRTKQLEEVAKVVNVELGKRLPPDERRSFDDAVQAAQMLHADGLEPPDDEPPAA
jgi:chromosome segregation ATPase